MLPLREVARDRLGERFDLAGFHGAVLDYGQLPLPAVGVAVDARIADVLSGAEAPSPSESAVDNGG